MTITGENSRRKLIKVKVKFSFNHIYSLEQKKCYLHRAYLLYDLTLLTQSTNHKHCFTSPLIPTHNLISHSPHHSTPPHHHKSHPIPSISSSHHPQPITSIHPIPPIPHAHIPQPSDQPIKPSSNPAPNVLNIHLHPHPN
ncbi:hypothetical protein EYC80_005293 [Monilinia laxa]|uniref:Uncharacterized protein n=1 Tax=Monilinia laxa TaxID=61186 RepID=A0A5N6KK12_MONLA|nr:hypothetical protein EYC80_005293 [Monilinia laxa]